MLDQERHVFETLTQWRQLKRNDVETIEKVGAKISLLDFDVEQARLLPGVVAVVTGQDLAEFPAFSTGLPRPEVNANERRSDESFKRNK